VRRNSDWQRWAWHFGGVAFLLASASGLAQVSVTKEAYLGWPNTYVLRNEALEVRVVTDVGPRIISLARTDGENIFHVRQNEAGKKGESEWVLRGGWRLWVAPERKETTYVPDNQPCTVKVTGRDTIEVTAPPQPEAGIQKIVEVRIVPGKLRVRLRSRIRNISSVPREYAPWSLAVMRPGGRALIPVDEGPVDAFDAVRSYILWSYARFDDPRYRWGSQLIQVDHRQVRPGQPWPGSQRRRDESKIGTDSKQGWAAYAWRDLLFLQRFPFVPGATYPDSGATIEVYSNAEYVELEHLGPLARIEPGQEIVFPEDWWLIADVRIPEDEADAMAALQPWLERTSR